MTDKLNQLADYWDRLSGKIVSESVSESNREGRVSREEASILSDCAKLVRAVMAGEIDPANLKLDGTVAQ